MKSIPNNSQNIKALSMLLNQHRKFHVFLDKTALMDHSMVDIDMLIKVRQFNLECITKYTNLIARKDILFKIDEKSANQTARFETALPNGLWGIHRRLSLLDRSYSTLLKSKKLNRVSRVIVSSNQDQMINIIDDLLHPIKELQLS